ncbi:MAG: ribonuclease H family protein [Prevotellaceae bacterium]|jgi:ribonuclease HI|nr:ribonuclease H family protein [Prevotellaceae bacterium]
MSKNKFYVVWDGELPGIYGSWEECRRQVEGFAGAKYKAFETEELANEAFHSAYYNYIVKKKKTPVVSADVPPPIQAALAVDAACSGNPGVMEYRGVYVKTRQEIFKSPAFKEGTNNIGEFLALAHGLALLKEKKTNIPVYSDSVSAISWVRQRRCKTMLKKNEKNAPVFDLIARAEKWLADNQPITNPILKWDTEHWGEIPADFGRK